MKTASKEAGKPGDFVAYPETPRDFHADRRPTCGKEKAEDGWKRLLEWFASYGVG